MAMSNDLETATQAAYRAGSLLLRYFRTNLDVSHKDGAFDPVTQADSEADDLLRSIISRQFPGDKLLTEENPTRPVDYHGRVWMIDPLDGTKDFILGRETFSVIIGLLVDGEPAMGVVYLPSTGELYYGLQGHGAVREVNGESAPISVSAVTALRDARMLVRIPTPEQRGLDKPIQALNVKERISGGSVGSRLCALASGRADVFVNTHHRVSKWDTLGAHVILSEAGGTLLDLSGNPLDYTQSEDRWPDPFVAASTKYLALQAIKSLGSKNFH